MPRSGYHHERPIASHDLLPIGKASPPSTRVIARGQLPTFNIGPSGFDHGTPKDVIGMSVRREQPNERLAR
jgi:hypothetical protein